MPESNRRQAMVPDGATVIENSRGSAPGLWLDDDDGRVVLLLPGPPRELRPMLSRWLMGPLRARGSGSLLLRRLMKIAGRIESQTDEELQPLYHEWALLTPPIGATILAQLGQIELHVFTRDRDQAHAVKQLEAAVAQAGRCSVTTSSAATAGRWSMSSATCSSSAASASRWRSRAPAASSPRASRTSRAAHDTCSRRW